MVKACPGCGATTVPEARFCRSCGAPLKAAGAGGTDAPVSPLAQTVPLTGEGRTTSGLGPEDSKHSASDTSRVGRAEMENILRRVPLKEVKDQDGSVAEETTAATSPAPQTTALASAAVDDAPTSSPGPTVAASAPVQANQETSNVRSRRLWQVAAVALLCVALIAGVLAFVLSRKGASTENSNSTPIAISDSRQLVAEKLAEAESLLAAGEFNPAVDVLRAALKLDPGNVEAHMRLGNALERTGSRTEAIAEYRAAAEIDPANVSAWRALASAQFEDELYNDSAESYRRLLAAGGNDVDDETWLAYGDALRMAGRAEEARAAYQKISASATNAIAQEARRHLAELKPTVATTVTEEHTGAARNGAEERGATVAATPTPSPLPTATPAPTVSAPNAVDYNALYFQALNIVNGRDLKKIERAELLHALALFQRAALGGSHSAEAQRYADKLGKEYDRRRKL